jgi:phosphatidylserine synthase
MKFIINKQDLHIANIFSILAFIIAFWWNYLIIINQIYVWFMVVLLACAFDILDWYLARKLNSKSSLWKILDSFSDVLIYLLPLILIYLIIYNFSYLFLIISSVLFFAWLFRLSYFTENWIKIIDNKKYYTWIPVYFLFILIITLFFNTNVFFINFLFIIVSLLMLLDIKIRKANLFISILYLIILFIFSYLFLIWIL